MILQVIERSQEIAIQAQEIDRREKELESSIRKPAEAEKFKLEKLAEADTTKKNGSVACENAGGELEELKRSSPPAWGKLMQ